MFPLNLVCAAYGFIGSVTNAAVPAAGAQRAQIAAQAFGRMESDGPDAADVLADLEAEHDVSDPQASAVSATDAEQGPAGVSAETPFAAAPPAGLPKFNHDDLVAAAAEYLPGHRGSRTVAYPYTAVYCGCNQRFEDWDGHDRHVLDIVVSAITAELALAAYGQTHADAAKFAGETFPQCQRGEAI